MPRINFYAILSIMVAAFWLNPAEADSQTNLDLIKDAAGMFNERGYLKSNSFSLDGNEVINDFNGNLVYVQRLDYQPLSQDGIHFDLKICYNGSVGHTSNSGLRRIPAGNGDQMNSLNLPEWIISINNIAIQTFNFENEPISWADTSRPGDSISQCNEVSALINGYHSCYRFNNATQSGIIYGTISILMGDGSVKELISVDSGLCDTSDNRYIYGFVFKGEYRTMSKDDRSRGYVNAADSTFTLFLDDGTRARFILYRPIWKTTIMDPSMIGVGDSLIMLLPIKFADQIGNESGLSYNYLMADNDTPVYGRPLIRSAGGWNFDWNYLLYLSTATQMTLTCDNDEYVIEYRHRGDTASQPSVCGESNRAYVTCITDPAHRKTSFSYGAYHLQGKQCRPQMKHVACQDGYGLYYRHAATTILLSPARIDSIYHPDGGRSGYCYFGDSADTLAVEYSSYLCNAGSVPPRPCIKTDYFNLLGRDPYFINMVIRRLRLNSGANGAEIASMDSLAFSWADIAPSGEISASDTFFTSRWVGKDSLSDQAQDDIKRYEYIYKQHPERGTYSDLERDRGWVVKLHQEKRNTLKDYTAIKIISNWDTRVDSTFQLIDRSITKDDVTATTLYDYQWYDSGDTNPLISNMIRQTVTDSWGIRTETFFNPGYFTVTDTNSYYTNSLIDSTKRYTPDSVLTEQSAKTYYDMLSTNGFPGQIQAEKKYIVDSGQVVDSLTEWREYFRGNDIYAPYNNGLLRKTTSPSGDYTLYHYREKFANPPKYGDGKLPPDSTLCPVTYYGLRFDGTIDTVDAQFLNPKPFWFKSLTYTASGNDSIETWQSVDNRGNIEKVVGPDRFLSELFYDKIFRLSTALLPGNFVPSGYYDTTYSVGEPRINSGHPMTDGTFRFEKRDSTWNAAIIEYCSAEELWAVDSLSNPKRDTTPDDVRQAIYFEFFNVMPGDSTIIDSVVLYVYGVKAGEGNLALLTERVCQCNHDNPTWHDSVGQSITVNLGENRFVLNHFHPSMALLSEDLLEPVSFAVYSSECSDSTKRPRLEIYYRQVYSTYANPVYALHYDYDDDTAGGTGITTMALPGIEHFPITNHLHFDGFGRVIQRDAVDSNQCHDSLRTTYDYSDRIASQIDQVGYATSYVYDVLDRKVKTTYPDSASSFDSTKFSYGDAQALGLDTLFTMRNSGLYKTSSLDENGHRITEYGDVLGRLRLRETSPQDGTTHGTYFDYDDNGNLTTIIKPNGDRVNYRYNSLGWLIKEWAADYDTIFREYDKDGRQVLYKDGGIKALDLDSGGPPYHWLYTRYDPLDRVTESGLLAVSGTDTVSRTSINRYFYDQHGASNSRGRLSLTYTNENGCNYGEKYDYDARGRLVGQTCFYNPVLDSTLNDSAFVEREREAGNDSVIMVAAKSGDVYYSLQRINSMDYSTFAAIIRRVAGEDSLVAITNNIDMGVGHMIDTVDGTVSCNAGDTIMLRVRIIGEYDAQFTKLYAVASYSYYSVYQKYLRDADVDYHLAFAYDLADNLTSITYPDGMVVAYGYDDRGRLATVGDTAHTDKYARISYTPRDEVAQMILGDDLQTVDYAYNARGWLNTINNGASGATAPSDLLGQRLYYYGHPDSIAWEGYHNGNIMAQKISMTGTTNESYHFTYDDLDRLTSVDAFAGMAILDMKERFTYDHNGNITALRRGGDSLAYYLASGKNRLDSLYISGRTVTRTHFTWDKNGNLASDDTRNGSFRYDPFNQMDTALFPGTDTAYIAFGYNTDGLRVYKDYYYTYLDDCDQGGEPGEKGSGDTLCLFHGRTLTRYVREKVGGKVLAEYGSNAQDPPNFKFIYAGDRRIAMYDKTGRHHFFLNDHLGSARMVIDSAGVVKDKYKRYFAYGGGASQTVSTGQKYQYTGQPYDDNGAFDLYYYGARYYDPVLSRFTSRDPMASKYPSWSPYAHTLDNPMRYRDPTGRVLDVIVDIGSVALSTKDFVNDPSWANAGWLAADVIGAIVPFLPAVGIVRHAGKAAGVAKAMDSGTDVAKTIDKGANATKSGTKGAKRVVDPSKIETHHRLPTKHKEKFSNAGLDIEDYTAPKMTGPHRLKEYGGLHTGVDSWNKQWGNFFEETPNANKEQILKQLDDMEQKLK